MYSVCELKLAFEHGYELLETFELWYYETESGAEECVIKPEDRFITYDELRERLIAQEKMEAEMEEKLRNEESNFNAVSIRQHELKKKLGFFNQYLDYFIKLKSEASGFPYGCVTREQKEQYVVEFFKENNVILRMENIENNPTKRAIGKQLMNSLYGKLIQSDRFLHQSVLRAPRELLYYLNSDIHEITDIYCPNNDYAIVSWRYKEDLDFEKPINVSSIHPRKNTKRHVCLTSGIQTTCYGRMKLYSIMSKLGKNLYYTDTDSVIFVVRGEDDYAPPLFQTKLEDCLMN